MLSVLERHMAARGHFTTVAACEGSKVAGRLLATGKECSEPDRLERRNAEHTTAILEHVWRTHDCGNGYDLIHDKSGHFWVHASALPLPVIATLHLPRHFYRSDMAHLSAPNLFFNCVSHSQQRNFEGLPNLLGVVENGIEIASFPFEKHKDNYLLWMGRICEEKGPHVALDLADRLGVPLVLAGQVYPFSYHQEYFQREIVPRLERARTLVTFVEKPSTESKLNLLRKARALIIPTLVDETSSLVAMEAMACGTPVVAFRRGAIPEVVRDDETGFVVDGFDEMVTAMDRVNEINPETCRAHVEARFSAERMAADYELLYAQVLQRRDRSANSAVVVTP